MIGKWRWVVMLGGFSRAVATHEVAMVDARRDELPGHERLHHERRTARDIVRIACQKSAAVDRTSVVYVLVRGHSVSESRRVKGSLPASHRTSARRRFRIALQSTRALPASIQQR